MEPKLIYNIRSIQYRMEGNEVAAMDISRIINRILYLVFHADSVRDAHAKFYYR